MDDAVNPPASLRTSQIALTEDQIVSAATRCFLDSGYARASLTAIADAAGVSHRTVYVRFGTKAALFKRVVDVAVVGDVEHVAVLDREWAQAALSAPTLEERTAAWASVARQILQRIGTLMAIAQEAAASEPEVAELVELGRSQSLEAERTFWTRLADDGLIDPAADLEWIVVTASILDSPETFVRATAQHSWSLDEYESWLATALLVLARHATGAP